MKRTMLTAKRAGINFSGGFMPIILQVYSKPARISWLAKAGPPTEKQTNWSPGHPNVLRDTTTCPIFRRRETAQSIPRSRWEKFARKFDSRLREPFAPVRG